MKRRPMTLIELVIALSLVSILLTTLLFWYGKMTKQKFEDQAARKPLLQEYYAYCRLEKVLEKIVLDSKGGKTLFGFDRSTGLVFTFDNGIHPMPQLSNIVLGKLAVEQGALRLTIWPQPTVDAAPTSPSETVIIIDGIDQMECAFLSAKPVDFLTVQPKQLGDETPSAGWHADWSSQLDRLPAQIHLVLSGDKQYDWVFDLHLPILYPVMPS